MIKVIYEDNHLLVLNKPSGLLTQPTKLNSDSLETRAKKWLKKKYRKKGNVFLEAIHRIDRPTSGIVVFAKTSKALSRLMAAIRAKKTQKRYQAWVEGVPHPSKATLEHYLVHDDYRATVVSKNTRGSKLARLHYRVIRKEKNKALLEIDLETGRYHQIRAQLSQIGYPIIGDTKYGSKTKRKDKSIALNHSSMSIPHPTQGTIMTFTT